MPAAPEIGHGGGDVGILKVLGQPEAQHLAQADGHPGIAAEIKIELQGKGQQRHPGHGGGQTLKANGGGLIPQTAQPVGQQGLHGKAQYEIPQTVVHGTDAAAAVGKLQAHPLRFHQRAGQELGKQENSRAVAQKAPFRLGFAAIQVHEIGGHLKGEEAHAQGKGDSLPEEAGILKAQKAAEQNGQASGKKQAPTLRSLHPESCQPGQEYQTQKECKAPDAITHPNGIKYQAAQSQHRIAAPCRNQIVNQEEGRQKEKYKIDAVKLHGLHSQKSVQSVKRCRLCRKQTAQAADFTATGVDITFTGILYQRPYKKQYIIRQSFYKFFPGPIVQIDYCKAGHRNRPFPANSGGLPAPRFGRPASPE